MDINNGRIAGILSGKIDAMTVTIGQIKSAMEGGYMVQNLTLRTMNEDGKILDIPLGTFDATATKAALDVANQLLAAQLAALNEQLSALA
jgi:hypothetical protein